MICGGFAGCIINYIWFVCWVGAKLWKAKTIVIRVLLQREIPDEKTNSKDWENQIERIRLWRALAHFKQKPSRSWWHLNKVLLQKEIIWKGAHCIGYHVSHEAAAANVFNKPILGALFPSSSASDTLGIRKSSTTNINTHFWFNSLHCTHSHHLKESTLHLISGVTQRSCSCFQSTNFGFIVAPSPSDLHFDTAQISNSQTNTHIEWKRPHCIIYLMSHETAAHVFNQPILSALLHWVAWVYCWHPPHQILTFTLIFTCITL